MPGELTDFAGEQQRRFDCSTSPMERKKRGHFGTPSAIAGFMASMISDIPKGVLRILDPGAGVGMLSAAICQRVLRQKAPRWLECELWENDPTLEPYLRTTMSYCQRALRRAGHRLEYIIRVDDFILANSQKTLFDDGVTPSFNLAILNPPYYKLRKESAQARMMAHVVRGQPNIYALFMAVAGELLLPGGEMVAITPRSYFNGPYFKQFRRWFFDRLIVRQIHMFESRTEAFRENEVLQESVILMAEKGGAPKDVILTTSTGREFIGVGRCTAPYNKVIERSSGDCIVRVPTNQFENEVVDAVDSLPSRFSRLGFEISTGPVVTFRSTRFLRTQRSGDTAPLFWMHNVRPFLTRFPPENGKPTHIVVSDESKRLLLPARRYVLLKRFTSKEEKRRLIAGILEASDSYSEWVGLENHLNYVYRKRRELSKTEAFGLAAFFNTALVDRYFRTVSGNTQVNASEIRAMPVPDLQTLARIGEEAGKMTSRDSRTVERIVGRALHLPDRLIEQLCAVAE